MVLPWPSPNAASALPTLSSFGEDRKGCACSRARPADDGTTSRSTLSHSSSVREPCVLLLRSEELPPRAGTGGGGACSVWLCKTRLLPLCSGRRQSRRRICRTSCTTRARLCPAACRPDEPLQPRCTVPFSAQVHWDRVWIARKVCWKKKTRWPPDAVLVRGGNPPGPSAGARRTRATESQACLTAPSSNYLVWSLAPSLPDEYARTRDEGVACCLADLLANDAPVHIGDLGRRRPTLPLKLAGLGLHRALETRRTDTLPSLG